MIPSPPSSLHPADPRLHQPAARLLTAVSGLPEVQVNACARELCHHRHGHMRRHARAHPRCSSQRHTWSRSKVLCTLPPQQQTCTTMPRTRLAVPGSRAEHGCRAPRPPAPTLAQRWAHAEAGAAVCMWRRAAMQKQACAEAQPLHCAACICPDSS